MTEATLSRIDKMTAFLQKHKARLEAMPQVKVSFNCGGGGRVKPEVVEYFEDELIDVRAPIT